MDVRDQNALRWVNNMIRCYGNVVYTHDIIDLIKFIEGQSFFKHVPLNEIKEFIVNNPCQIYSERIDSYDGYQQELIKFYNVFDICVLLHETFGSICKICQTIFSDNNYKSSERNINYQNEYLYAYKPFEWRFSSGARLSEFPILCGKCDKSYSLSIAKKLYAIDEEYKSELKILKNKFDEIKKQKIEGSFIEFCAKKLNNFASELSKKEKNNDKKY